MRLGKWIICALVIALALPAFAATRVVVAPDRQVRPGVTVPVWGMAGNGGAIGDGTANGEAYAFSFGANPDVAVTDDGDLTGIVGNDRFIAENVSFTLLNGSCRELITATLTVGGQPSSNSVTFDIVDSCDPISDTALEALAVDTNIGIADSARCLLQKQLGNGSWNADGSSYGAQDGATTGFAVWALENSGHLPTGDPNQDVYVDFVNQGLSYLQGTGAVSGTGAAQANVAREATAAGVSDLNTNGQSLRLASADTWRGYSHPIATAAFIASLDTASFQSLVEDAIDFIGVMQNPGPFGRGGWDYNGPSSRSDNSINSWNWMALEGGETTAFAINAPDWMLEEGEYTLNSHQTNAAGQPFGYTGPGPLRGAAHGQATTCGGLSGLAAADLENVVGPGAVIATNGAPLNTIAAKRQAALDYMGNNWAVTTNSNFLGFANKGNFYAMWTCCRAFRLTEASTGSPVTLVNGGVPFDWESGEENPPSGILAGPATAREGYVPFLLRNQDADGCWAEGTYVGTTLETAMGLLCLNPTVFGPPQAECPEPDPRTQGYWHRQCLGMDANDPECPGIDPGRNGRGPSEPNDPDFCPDLYNCSNQALEDLGFFGELTCDALNADPANDKCEKALKQLTAVILNRCSDRTAGTCEVDLSAQGCSATDVNGAIQEITDLINGGDCETAAACAGAINEGDALVDGNGGGETLEYGESDDPEFLLRRPDRRNTPIRSLDPADVEVESGDDTVRPRAVPSGTVDRDRRDRTTRKDSREK